MGITLRNFDLESWRKHRGHVVNWAEEVTTGLLLAICKTCSPSGDIWPVPGEEWGEGWLIDVFDDPELKEEIRKSQGGRLRQCEVNLPEENHG